MDQPQLAFHPVIHCTPPTDPSFLATVSRSYAEATELLSGEAAVCAGTLVRLRVQYPRAAIIPLVLAPLGAPTSLWLVSREGWTEIETVPSVPSGVARISATTGGAVRRGA
jgi:hypothetical protein